MIPFILTENNLTMVINNKPYTIADNHTYYGDILDELRGDQDIQVILNLIEVSSTIKQYVDNSSNELTVDLEAGIITFNGKEVHSVLVSRIIDMYTQGFNVDPMVKFLHNLYQNPSVRAVNELYGFLEYGKLPITEDGYFLAYKKVNSDYTSVHDSRTKNEIGTVVSMPRDQVNSDSTQTCSYGLHLCSHEYLSFYSGNKVLILKVNPRDVVSIPVDYNNTKARACAYEIIGELGVPDIQVVQDKQPIMKEAVADLSDYELQKPIIPVNEGDIVPVYSNWFRAAYSHGFAEGKGKHVYNNSLVEAGDILLSADKSKQLVITQQQADDTNEGYSIGFKDGKGHNKRLVPRFETESLFSI